MKKVIDYNTLKCIETFEESKTNEIIQKYISLGKWDNVDVDSDGDIILSNDEDLD